MSTSYLDRKNLQISRRKMLLGSLASTFCLTGPVKGQEPVTAAAGFVGLALLQGAISYVGGQLMARVLGDATITDVGTWIHEAVRELEAFIVVQLDARIIQQIEADFQGVQDNLREYANLKEINQKANKYLLESSNTKTASEIHLSLNYDQTFFLSTAGMGFRLFTLQALFELDHDPGHVISARPMLDDFVAKTSASRDRISANLVAQIPPYVKFCEIRRKFCRTRHCPPPTTYSCRVLGKKPTEVCCTNVVGAFDVPIANQASANSQADALMNSLTAPARKTHSDFVSQANAAINLATTCYDKMCRQVGSNYPITANASTFSWANFPGTISMLGAVVKLPQ